MWGEEVTGGTRIGASAPACLEGAGSIEDADAPSGSARLSQAGAWPAPGVETEFGHVNPPLPVDRYLTGPGYVGPLASIAPIAREKLNPAILAVGHVDDPFLIHGDAVRQVKLCGTAAGLSPGLNEPALGREVMDSGVAVTVRDIDIAEEPEGDVGRVVKRRTGALNGAVIGAGRSGVRGLAARSQGPEQLSRGREEPDGVVEVIGAVDRIIGADEESVRPNEQPFSPPGGQRPVRLEDLDWTRTTEKDKDPVAAVASNRHGFTVGPTGREGGPGLVHSITKGTLTDADFLLWPGGCWTVHRGSLPVRSREKGVAHSRFHYNMTGKATTGFRRMPQCPRHARHRSFRWL